MASLQTVTTGSDGTACLDGLVVSSLVGDYKVEETVPAGYKANSENTQTFSVVEEATCSTGPKAGVEFSNTPLNVTVSVDSQVDGGTASTIDCGTADSTTTGPNGDGSLSANNLEPTAPDATVTCTITVDP